jgi:hypothetical protein
MMGRMRAGLSLILSVSACSGLVACSNSNGGGSTTSTYPPSTTIISAAQVTALQAVVANGKTAGTAPPDTSTARVAAQLTELEHQRATALLTADLLDVAAKDPKNATTATQLGTYRQEQLTLAGSVLSQIKALLASTKVAGKDLLAQDGGADRMLMSVVAQSFAAKAQALLNAGAAGVTNGGIGPSSNEISTFLQEEAIVTGDEGTGGHDVAGRLAAYALLGDASVASIVTAEGGVP